MQVDEERNINEVKGSPRNPRSISKHDFASLKTSIKTFGDLSGVVRNIRNDRLVGGHQRVEAFRALKAPKIVINERLETPNSVGTVARGFVVFGDEKFGYREVDWTVEFEEAANVAANRIQGEWDADMLAQIMYEMSDELRELTGQTEDEIAKLLGQVSGDGESDDDADETPEGHEQMIFTLSIGQADVLRRAIESAKSREDFKDQANENSNGNALYFMALNYLGAASVTMTEPVPAADSTTPTAIPGAPSANQITDPTTAPALAATALDDAEQEFE